MHCDFDTGSLKVNIFKVLFWDEGGGHTKNYSVYACDNPDNSERPVIHSCKFIRLDLRSRSIRSLPSGVIKIINIFKVLLREEGGGES